MTYLELCRKLAREAELTASASVPTAVTSQTGQLGRVVGWVADAWVDIQNRHEGRWKWLKRAFSFDTVAATSTYAYGSVTDVDAGAAITRFARWDVEKPEDPPFAYLQSSGVGSQFRLQWMPFDIFRQRYRFGSQTDNRPVHISVDEQNRIVLGPAPDAIYVVTGFFYRSAQTLAADGDTPEMPSQFHSLVWREAIQMYAANSVASEVFTRAVREGTRTMRQLERNQLPQLYWPEPLA